MKISSKKLNNQFKVIFAKDVSNPLICMQLYIHVGSNWEYDKEAGFSHFTEHLVFKSTKKFPGNSLMERATFLGGSINAYTEFDSTCFFITLPSKFINEGIEILSEIAQNADFNENEFNSEKQIIIEEIKQFQNEPEDFFIEEIAKSYFKKNPYKNPIIGNYNSLQRATPIDLRKFYTKYYIPDNCFLIVTGNFEKDNLFKIINKYFGNWNPKELLKKKIEIDDLPKNPIIQTFSKTISNDILAFVFPDLAESHPDSYALSLAVKAFASGKNSILYTRLFDDEKLIDGIKVHSLTGINNGASIILIMPKNKSDLNKITDIFLEELSTFNLFGIQKIEEHKKEQIFFYRYSYEYVESLASSLGIEEIHLGYEHFQKYPEKLQKINKQDVDKTIKTFFKPMYLGVFHIGKKELNKSRIKDRINRKSKVSSQKEFEDFYETTLKNGMKILLKKVIGKPTIGISLSLAVSQLNEINSNKGINLLTSGLMLYGNEKRNYQQFLNYCTSNGINCGISPLTETTTIRLKCFKETISETLDLLLEIVSSPIFPEDYLENLKLTYASNIDRIKDYPSYYAEKLWKEQLFGKKSNLINIEGNKTSICKITRKQIKNWFKSYFHPQNIALAIVGDFDFDEILKNLGKFIFPIYEGQIKSEQKANIHSSKQNFKRLNKKGNQSIIHIGGFGSNSMDFEKNTAFHILAQIIGGDTNSILFRELREKRGLAYSVEFDFSSIRELGYFVASAIVDKQRESEAIKTIVSVLDDIKENGIIKQELEKTKNYIRGQRLREEESMLNQAFKLSNLESLGLGYQYYLKREERLEKVNIDSIHKIAQEYFDEEKYWIHVLS